MCNSLPRCPTVTTEARLVLVHWLPLCFHIALTPLLLEVSRLQTIILTTFSLPSPTFCLLNWLGFVVLVSIIFPVTVAILWAVWRCCCEENDDEDEDNRNLTIKAQVCLLLPVCVCLCVCVCVFMCMCAYAYVCVCMRESDREGTQNPLDISSLIPLELFIYFFIYLDTVHMVLEIVIHVHVIWLLL